MLNRLSRAGVVKRIRKSPRSARARQRLPMRDAPITDDRTLVGEADPLAIAWPAEVAVPRVGIVRDPGMYPRWTKYRRLLESTGIPHAIFNVHASDWMAHAREFDIVVGVPSCQGFELQEIRTKYEVLEEHLGIACYPSARHLRLYEDKEFEAYLCEVYGLPFARTHISHDREDALALIRQRPYPLVSKIVPSSGSVGVQLVKNERSARRIVRAAFSPAGRPTHVLHTRQKNFVYFQEFVPNDGQDLRIKIIGDLVSGFYRRAPAGDFRASGMDREEHRDLPVEAIRIARRANTIINSPQLSVDLVHGRDGGYTIIELSPIDAVRRSDDLQVDGVPGIYELDGQGVPHFRAGKFWVPELALRQFLIGEYLPRLQAGQHG